MCRKEAQPTTPASSPDRAYNPGPKIRAFIASAKEPRQTKSNGTFTIRDAEWNIEAALNMGRADPNARFGDTRSVKYTYRMDVSEGLVAEDDVLSGYLALEANLDATEMDYYEQATVVDVSNEVDGIEVLFTAEMFIGKNPDVPVSYGPPYTNNLTPHKSRIAAPTYWWCEYPLSADLVVKDRVNYGLGIYPCCLTDVETWYVRAYHAPIIWPFEVTDVDLANRLIPTVNYRIELGIWMLGERPVSCGPNVDENGVKIQKPINFRVPAALSGRGIVPVTPERHEVEGRFQVLLLRPCELLRWGAVA